jgi:hypothetical protein
LLSAAAAMAAMAALDRPGHFDNRNGSLDRPLNKRLGGSEIAVSISRSSFAMAKRVPQYPELTWYVFESASEVRSCGSILRGALRWDRDTIIEAGSVSSCDVQASPKFLEQRWEQHVIT